MRLIFRLYRFLRSRLGYFETRRTIIYLTQPRRAMRELWALYYGRLRVRFGLVKTYYQQPGETINDMIDKYDPKPGDTLIVRPGKCRETL